MLLELGDQGGGRGRLRVAPVAGEHPDRAFRPDADGDVAFLAGPGDPVPVVDHDHVEAGVGLPIEPGRTSRHPQVCLDATSRQLLGQVTPSLPAAPGGRRGRTTRTSAGGCATCSWSASRWPAGARRRSATGAPARRAHSDHGAGRGPRPRCRADRAGPGQPRAPTPRRRWIRGSDRPSQAAGRSAGAARHPQAWQLGQHGRDRAGHAGWTGGWPTRRPWRGGRGLAGGAQPGRSWGQLAVHHRRCSHQAPAPLPLQLRADELPGAHPTALAPAQAMVRPVLVTTSLAGKPRRRSGSRSDRFRVRDPGRLEMTCAV
jgi:hypothetical protein